MPNFVNTLIYLFVGYLVGIWLAPDVFSSSVSMTSWDDLWVYAYLLFWPFILFWKMLIWALIIGATLFVIAFIYDRVAN